MRREDRNDVRYYGARRSDKLVRCYYKKQVSGYRVEVELHSGLLRRQQIGSVDALIFLPDIVMSKHLRFVDFDWDKFDRYLIRHGARGADKLEAGARRYRKSIHRLLAYLRRQGIPNPHRFLATHSINKRVRRALDAWEREFFRR